MNNEFSIKGTVVKGDAEARVFGFPTANIEIESDLASGVYAGYVDLEDQSYRAAIIINPKKMARVLEAHLIGFEGDLYGKEITLRVENFIRGWMNFPSLEEGKEQIRKDIEIIKYNHRYTDKTDHT